MWYQITQILMLISNSLEQLQKTRAKKSSTKNRQKKGVFDFYQRVQKFSTYNYFWVTCSAFLSTQHQIVPKHFYILNMQFLLILKPSADGSKI